MIRWSKQHAKIGPLKNFMLYSATFVRYTCFAAINHSRLSVTKRMKYHHTGFNFCMLVIRLQFIQEESSSHVTTAGQSGSQTLSTQSSPSLSGGISQFEVSNCQVRG